MKNYERALVFDAKAWNEAGGDIGDNKCFWKSAIVIRKYQKGINARNKDGLVDVIFDDGTTSHGHFESMIKPLCNVDAKSIPVPKEAYNG